MELVNSFSPRKVYKATHCVYAPEPGINDTIGV